MSDLIDQPLPGFGPDDISAAMSEGNAAPTMARVMAFPSSAARTPERVIDLRGGEPTPAQSVAAHPAGSQRVSAAKAQRHPSSSVFAPEFPRPGQPRVERRQRTHRPGVVGGVTVRAPLLDPTRHAVKPNRTDGRVKAGRVRRVNRAGGVDGGGSAKAARHLHGDMGASARPNHRPGTQRSEATSHPRVQERRAAIKRSGRFTRARSLVPLITIGALGITGALVAFVSPVFAVTRVAVEFRGNAQQDAQLGGIVASMKGRNLLRLDIDKSQSEIAALPWVDSVSVRRSLPHTVSIDVRAHSIAGVIMTPGGKRALTSTDGTVLMMVTANDPSVAGLAVIDVGARIVPSAGDRFSDNTPAVLSSAAALEQRMPGALQRVVLRKDQLQWTVKHPSGRTVIVKVGVPIGNDAAAAALTSVFAMPGRVPSVVDLRSPDTPVLTFAEERAR
jgi:cell division septal protein FtsQ